MIESADEFVRLRRSEDPREYERAAAEAAPIEVWHEVIRRYPEMRQWVAHNKSVPLSILETLATDAEVNVRVMVAMKNKLTPELFRQLAADPDESVRARIAYNRNAPEAVLLTLAGDRCAMVAEAARSHLDRKRGKKGPGE